MRLLLAAVFLLSSGAVGCRPTADEIYAVLPPIGSQVPAFSYATISGTTVTPESLSGRPTVIAFWSTTCTASLMALKSIAALQVAYAPRGANVVILADDRDSAVVASLFSRLGVQTPAALGAGTLEATFSHGQSVLPWKKTFPFPTFLVLDVTGKVVYRQFGIERDSASRLERVRARLDSLLANPTKRISA